MVSPAHTGNVLSEATIAQLEAANWYRVAALEFERIAGAYPTAPEAPRALYSAATARGCSSAIPAVWERAGIGRGVRVTRPTGSGVCS